VPDAETPKEHPRATDKDRQVHHFQIICSTRFSLSEVSVSVRASSQSARPLAVRELIFIVIISEVALFTVISPCIYKTRTTKLLGCNGAFDARHPGVTRITPDGWSGIGARAAKSAE